MYIIKSSIKMPHIENMYSTSVKEMCLCRKKVAVLNINSENPPHKGSPGTDEGWCHPSVSPRWMSSVLLPVSIVFNIGLSHSVTPTTYCKVLDWDTCHLSHSQNIMRFIIGLDIICIPCLLKTVLVNCKMYRSVQILFQYIKSAKPF